MNEGIINDLIISNDKEKDKGVDNNALDSLFYRTILEPIISYECYIYIYLPFTIT